MSAQIRTVLAIFRYHWMGVLFVGVSAVTLALPFIFLRTNSIGEFRGVLPSLNNDDWYYTARVQDSIDGHVWLSNPYLWEHKNGSPQQTFLAEFTLSRPLKLFGLDAAEGRQLYSIILPAIIAGLTYAILFSISARRSWAVLIASFVFFYVLPFKMLRPVSPQFNFIFWLTLFFLLWKIANGARGWKIVLLAGANFGVIFYLYPYYMTYYAAFLGLLCVAYFFLDRDLSKRIFFVFLCGTAVGSLYVYMTYQATQLPYHEESLTRLGMIYSRFPSGIKIVIPGALVLFGYIILLQRKIILLTPQTVLMMAGVLAASIGVNQHIVTNRNLLFAGHFYQLNIFVCTFASTYLLRALFTRYEPTFSRPVGRYIIMVGVVGIMSISVYTMYRYASGYLRLSASEKVSRLQDYRSVFDWLGDQTPFDSVVYANEEIANLIPIYTHNNVFYSRNANLFILSEEEVMQRFLAQNFFETFNREFVLEHTQYIYGARHVAWYGHTVQGNKARRVLGLSEKPEVFLPEPQITAVLNEAAKEQQGSFEDAVKRYRIDYLVWDKRKDPHWDVEKQSFLQRVFEEHDLVIYRVR